MSNMTTDMLSGHSSPGHEYLIFNLAQEEYGIDILKVQEIRRYDQVTRIPNSPQFITGVTNLRGVIVPIIDLRVKFHLGSAQINHDTAIIVLNLNERVVGIVVDGVSDVLSLNTEQIKPAPDFSATLSTQYLLGLGLLSDRMLILIDIEKLISSDEMELVDKITKAIDE